MPYPKLIGRQSGITGDYKIRRLPTLYIIDKKGAIRFSGIFMKADEMADVIDSLTGHK